MNNGSEEKKNYLVPIVGAVSLVVGIILGSTFFGRSFSKVSLNASNSKFNEILSHIKRSYVDEVSIDSLANYGIDKMLEKLDPHTSYLPPQDAQLAQSELQNGFDGIGVEFNIFNDSLYVISALAGGPSEAVGIQSGDIIIQANETKLVGKTLNNNIVFKNLRGPRNSLVKLTLIRKGFPKPLIFNVKRDKIPTYTVDAAYMMPDKKTGFIKVNRFGESTYEEFKTQLSNLKSKGMSQLIIDLRGNPGGYMDRATDMVDELVGGNGVIVYTKGKDPANNYKVDAGKKGIFESGKIVVLVDEGSASASEIVSGSLQDYDRATIVGRRTFGKGLVQAPISLSDGSELRLTISRYYIPSGRSIQKPYTLGKQEEYMEDLMNRQQHKEYLVKDSIKYNQKLKYKTKSGKVVYGGGGITPDIFIPQDTTYYTPYLFSLFGKNVFRDFTIKYVSANRDRLTKMGFENYLSSFNIDESILVDFKKNGAIAGVEYNEKEYQRSKNFIQTQLKAGIARSIWKGKDGLSNEFYKTLFANDPFLEAAIKNLGK